VSDDGAGYELYKLWLGGGANYWELYSDQYKQRWESLADAMADVVRMKVNEATGTREGLDSLSDRLYSLAEQGDFHLKDDPVTPPVTVKPEDYVEPRRIEAGEPVDTSLLERILVEYFRKDRKFRVAMMEQLAELV